MQGNALQHTTTHCNTLQHKSSTKVRGFSQSTGRTATHCNTLQQTCRIILSQPAHTFPSPASVHQGIHTPYSIAANCVFFLFRNLYEDSIRFLAISRKSTYSSHNPAPLTRTGPILVPRHGTPRAGMQVRRRRLRMANARV